MSEPRQVHWVVVELVLRYLPGTIAYGLRYTSSGGVTLLGYTDSDWVGSAVDRVDVCSFVRHRWCPPGWLRMGDGSSLSLGIQ